MVCLDNLDNRLEIILNKTPLTKYCCIYCLFVILKSIIALDYHGYKQKCGTNSGLIQCRDIITNNTK